MKRTWIAGAIFVAAVAAAGVASAHIVLAVREAPAGSYYKAAFQVPHGCNGAATTGLRITLPPDVVVAKPAPKTGWQLTIEREKLAHPITNEGHELTERVKLVLWEGGRLPDDEFEEFVIMVRLPARGGRIAFPVVQSCGGQEVDWVQEPTSDGKSPHPAPLVLLTGKD